MWQSCIDKLLSRAIKVYTYNTTCRIKELLFTALKCNTPYSYVVTQSRDPIPFLKEHKQMIHFQDCTKNILKVAYHFFSFHSYWNKLLHNLYYKCNTNTTISILWNLSPFNSNLLWNDSSFFFNTHCNNAQSLFSPWLSNTFRNILGVIAFVRVWS